MTKDLPLLPRDCNFTMQQWLYRRTLRTKRYKRCYIVLHHERLYTFPKISSFDKCEPQSLLSILDTESNWVLPGADVIVEPNVINGLYRWKVIFKSYKKGRGSEYSEFIADKEQFAGEVDEVDELFNDISHNFVHHKESLNTTQVCVWFATTNHKVAIVSCPGRRRVPRLPKFHEITEEGFPPLRSLIPLEPEEMWRIDLGKL